MFCISVGGFTYAYFNVSDVTQGSLVDVSIDETALLSLSNSGDISLEVSKDNFLFGAGSPTATGTATATLMGGANSSAQYYVYLSIYDNTFEYTTYEQTPELILTILDENGDPITYIDGLEYVTVNDISGFDVTTEVYSNFLLRELYDIHTGDADELAHNYDLILTMVNLDSDQNANSEKEFSATLILSDKELAFDPSWFYTGGISSILDSYNTTYDQVVSKGTVTTTSGSLYAIADDYTATTGVYSIFFKGAVNNNWVKFNNMYWRILRITGSGEMKMIYSGTTAPSASQATIMSGAGSIASYNPVTKTTSAEMVGYMYTLNQTRGYGTSNTVKEYVDNFYKSYFLGKDIVKYLGDTVYCSDRTSTDSGIGKVNQSYGPQWRINAGTIQVKCSNKNDAFTANDTVYGNGAMAYPIGMISSDESRAASYSTSSYLYNGASYFTMSPHSFATSYGYFYYNNENGGLTGYVATSQTRGIRPVISLNSDVRVSGTGLYNNPYQVITS